MSQPSARPNAKAPWNTSPAASVSTAATGLSPEIMGLGPVEAALIPLLAAAATTRSGAVLATLAYRVASLWIPLLLAAPIAIVAGIAYVLVWEGYLAATHYAFAILSACSAAS